MSPYPTGSTARVQLVDDAGEHPCLELPGLAPSAPPSYPGERKNAPGPCRVWARCSLNDAPARSASCSNRPRPRHLEQRRRQRVDEAQDGGLQAKLWPSGYDMPMSSRIAGTAISHLRKR
jgi:hypothetical protein